MSIFIRVRGCPGRVSVREAATRSGHDNTQSGGDAVLLDVRESYEWQAGHAPRAVHLSLSALFAGAGLPPHAQARPLIVICRAGTVPGPSLQRIFALMLLAVAAFMLIDAAV